MNTPFGKKKFGQGSYGAKSMDHKMDKFEKSLAKSDDVKTAFNVLQALWKTKGEKPMKMVVEIKGKQRNGEVNTTRLTVTVSGEYIEE